MRKPLYVLAALVAMFLGAQPLGAQAGPVEKISRFGEYAGYSAPLYDGVVRTSRYLTMRDGIRIAIDIVRPSIKGKVEEKPLPAVFIHTRYRRSAVAPNGKVMGEADSPLNRALLRYGYVLAVADVRGSGASFGEWRGLFSPEETRDAYEIIEWLAVQPWCDGKIGMTGGSYLGATQLNAASTKPPHLRALFPIVPLFDTYAIAWHNGVFFSDMVKTWSDGTTLFDTKFPAAPVDEDRDGSLLAQALAGHARSRSTFDIFAPLRFRDSRDEKTGAYPMRDWHAAGRIKEIAEAKVPMYIWTGWFDGFTRDGILMWKNSGGGAKLAIGNWPHAPDPSVYKEVYGLIIVEELRWFDYWLKGIDNGVMAGPAVSYQVMQSPGVNEWKTAVVWPVPEARQTEYFLTGSGAAETGARGGGLATAPGGAPGRDEYTADFTTTSGTTTRWDNAVGGRFGYPDMSANDARALAYTTAPLAADVEVTGHPVVRLWVSSTAGDGDYFAYLEEVDAAGVSRYVTEGTIRASYRATGAAPYDYLGLPYHRAWQKDLAPAKPNEPIELVFALEPTANVFSAGNRIRLTIACADKDNAAPTVVSPAPKITLYREKDRSSRLFLPIVGGK
jgi:putative CocE/NonD family hydrolase